MGLFDDLPSAKRDAPETARDDSPAAKRAAAAETDADRVDARSSDPATRGADPARTDGARNPVGSATAASHAEALERLAAHIAKPAKFKRASALAAELMRSGELERRHGKSVFALLAAAMTPPSRAVDPRTRFEYRDLFAAAATRSRPTLLNMANFCSLMWPTVTKGWHMYVFPTPYDARRANSSQQLRIQLQQLEFQL